VRLAIVWFVAAGGIPNVDAAFGRVVRALRLERGLSQEQLGHDSGGGRTFVSELERGEKGASLKTLFRLAPHLGVAPHEVIRRVEDDLLRDQRRRNRR
jgi:transcriptional regulator with XRE-family HTH domain